MSFYILKIQKGLKIGWTDNTLNDLVSIFTVCAQKYWDILSTEIKFSSLFHLFCYYTCMFYVFTFTVFIYPAALAVPILNKQILLSMCNCEFLVKILTPTFKFVTPIPPKNRGISYQSTHIILCFDHFSLCMHKSGSISTLGSKSDTVHTPNLVQTPLTVAEIMGWFEIYGSSS